MPTSIQSDSKRRTGIVSGSGPLAKLHTWDCLSVRISRTPGAFRCSQTQAASEMFAGRASPRRPGERTQPTEQRIRVAVRLEAAQTQCSKAMRTSARTCSFIVPEKCTTATKNIPEAGCASATDSPSLDEVSWRSSEDELLAATNLMAHNRWHDGP